MANGRQATITIAEGLYRQIPAIPHEALPPLERELLLTIERLCTEKESPKNLGPFTLTRKALEESLFEHTKKQLSASHFSNLVGSFKKRGILKPSPGEEGKSKPRHHTLTTLKPLFTDINTQKPSGPKHYATKARVKAEYNQALAEKNALPSNDHELKYALQDILLNGMFDTVMLLSKNPDITTLSDTISFGNRPLHLTSRALSGRELMEITDQRLLRPLLAYSQMTIRAHQKAAYTQGINRQIPNLFVISDEDLCRLLGKRPSLAVANTAIGMMERMSDTEFDVDASENPVFRRLFSYNSEQQVKRFRMGVLKFDSADVEGESTGKMFFYRLDERLFISMLSTQYQGQLFKAHLELRQELSGILQAVHNWVRRSTGSGNNNALWDESVKLKTIHQETLPKIEYKYFARYFLSALQKGLKWADEAQERYLLHGIEIIRHIKPGRGKDLYAIRVDPHDEVLGQELKRLAKKRDQERREKAQAVLSGWQPSEATLSELMSKGATEEFILGKLKEFADYWTQVGAVPKNTDQHFLKYVTQGLAMQKADKAHRKTHTNVPLEGGARKTRDIPLEEELNDSDWAYEPLFSSVRANNEQRNEYDGIVIDGDVTEVFD